MKILVIICTGFVPWGGLTTVAMNYYRAMSRDGLAIDFASNNEAPTVLLEELQRNGSRYYQLPKRKKIFRYVLEIFKIIGDYDTVHIHGNSATMTLELFPAVLKGIPNRIVQCHNSRPTAKRLSKFLRPMFLRMYTQPVAVSEIAGDWLYGKGQFLVLNNAIPVRKYIYDHMIRNIMRTKLKITDNVTVYGHVGKINSQKNHSFLIDVFGEIKKTNNNSVLLLVGDGDLRGALEKKILGCGLTDSVIFAGMTEETEKWLQAMDCFIFPSHYEGFGLAFTEAQANGLVCIGSSAVSESACILESTKLLDLSKGAAVWAEEIGRLTLKRTAEEEVLMRFQNAHMDIEKEADVLRGVYMENMA